jgi:hypothetical protein
MIVGIIRYIQYICKTQIDIQPLIDIQFSNPDICTSDICPFFSNRGPMTSLTYALTLTNKSAIDLRIWKGCRFENTFTSDCDFEIMKSVDADLKSGRWFESECWFESIIYDLLIKNYSQTCLQCIFLVTKGKWPHKTKCQLISDMQIQIVSSCS